MHQEPSSQRKAERVEQSVSSGGWLLAQPLGCSVLIHFLLPDGGLSLVSLHSLLYCFIGSPPSPRADHYDYEWLTHSEFTHEVVDVGPRELVFGYQLIAYFSYNSVGYVIVCLHNYLCHLLTVYTT